MSIPRMPKKITIKDKIPTFSKVKRFKPYTLDYFPVIQFEDLCDKHCFYTPYFNLIKGSRTYIQKDMVNLPNSIPPQDYNQYGHHAQLFESKMMELINTCIFDISSTEPEFSRNSWISRIRNKVPVNHHLINSFLFAGFNHLISLYNNNVHELKDSYIYFKTFLFNPQIPVPVDSNGNVFRLIRPSQTRLIQQNLGNDESRYVLDFFIQNGEKFPGCGSIPLIDFTNQRIIDFVYFDPTWMNHYDSAQIDNYTLGFLFDSLFKLWLWRYAAASLDNLKGNQFQLNYFSNPLFPYTNPKTLVPNIADMQDIGNFSLYIITPSGIYDEDLFQQWNLNPNQILAEKLIATSISLSNRYYRVKSIPMNNCPFRQSGIPWSHRICSSARDAKCFSGDLSRFPLIRHEVNVGTFQKLLRNEYFRFSKYFYHLDFSLGKDLVDEYRFDYDFYIGEIQKINNEFYYIDKSSKFAGNPPAGVDSIQIIPVSPYIFSLDWKLKEPFAKRSPQGFLFNSNYNTLLEYFFRCHGSSSRIDVMLISPQDFKFLFLIRKQQQAIWDIVRHNSTDRNGNRLTADQIMDSRLSNNSKRFGASFFGNSIYYTE